MTAQMYDAVKKANTQTMQSLSKLNDKKIAIINA